MRISSKVLILMLTCLFAVALVGCSSKSGTAPKGNEVEIEKAAILVASGYAQGRYQLVDQEQMKNWIDLGEIMTIVDVRPSSDYLKGHLPGAVNAEINRDEESTTEQIEVLLGLLPENFDSYVVFYDDYTALNGSHRGAIYAADAGYTNVFRFVGGAVAWEDADNKMTKK